MWASILAPMKEAHNSLKGHWANLLKVLIPLYLLQLLFATMAKSNLL